MRLIGVLLLIAVIVAGFHRLVTPAPAVVVPAAAVEPVNPIPSPPAAPPPDPRVDDLEAQVTDLQNRLNQATSSAPAEPTPTSEAPRAAHGCVATPGNGHGASWTLTVSEGHLLSVQWYVDGGPQEQSVLPAGTWQPNDGVRVGAYWDYPDCDEATVINQAVASNGSTTAASAGFTRG